MTATTIEAIVLDFDGVVIESNGVKTEAFRDVFSAYPEHADAAMAYHNANAWKSRYDKIDFLLGLLGRPGDASLREHLANDFSRRTLDRLVDVPFVSGAPEFLEEFSTRVPLFVASVTPQADLDATIARRHLAPFFKGVFGCPPWTKTTAIQHVVQRHGHDQARVVLIGDAPGDLRAASEAGVRFIARRSEIPFADPQPILHPDMFAIGDVIRSQIA